VFSHVDKKKGELRACARAQFSGCNSMTNAHSETEQMAVCCQNLTLRALSSRRALTMLVGAPFKKVGFFLNTPCTARAMRTECVACSSGVN